MNQQNKNMQILNAITLIGGGTTVNPKIIIEEKSDAEKIKEIRIDSSIYGNSKAKIRRGTYVISKR